MPANKYYMGKKEVYYSNYLQLDKLLSELILPGIKHKIEHRWSGIMGIGTEKIPIIQFYGKRTLIAVRMGGMGIAIGTWVGEKAAALLD